MLQQLRVRNLSVVEKADVRFGRGLTVVTGETGAGKSVLIGALDLVLGERADRGIVRAGASEASVEAVFQLEQVAAVNAVLDEAGLPPCDEGQLVVRRSVAASGTGRCWINDGSATVQTLRKIGQYLVDMHGPYDHQSLFSPDFQRELLDAFGHCGDALAIYGDAYAVFRARLRDYEALRGDTTDVSADIDRLQFMIGEISAAALSEADDETLVQQHAEAANAGEILELGTAVTAQLDDAEGSAFEALTAVQQRLAELARLLPDAADWLGEARSAAVQLQELSRSINGRLQRVEADPAELARLEARMALVQKLKRKYGPTLADVLATLAAHEERLAELQSRGERLEKLEQEIAQARQEVTTRAVALTRVRTTAATKLARAVTRELRDLGFTKAAFDVALTPREAAADGADDVVFGFAPNPGEPRRPLRAIASSGEIARVMLATKAVLAEHDRIPLLVFDEIDANIGGETGRAVGRKLRAVAEAHQIICITHLPQVAAYGQAHFAVTKRIQGQRTCARIEPVADNARAAELARMLGGEDMTPVTLAHATEMLRACQENAAP